MCGIISCSRPIGDDIAAKNMDVSLEIKLVKSRLEQNKSASVAFKNEDPLKRKKKEIRARLDLSRKQRLASVKKIPVFQGLTPSQLESVCFAFDEVSFKRNDVIMKQGDRGDAFFLVNDGTVSVTITTADEWGIPFEKEVARLGSGASFGEVALLTEEPRSATITVTSLTALCLRMTKEMFDNIIAATQASHQVAGEMISKEAVNSVPLFKKLTQATKNKLLAALTLVTYPPQSYICRQGTIGNTFYIITAGECRVTISPKTGGPEKQVATLRPGDFFGELLGSPRTRIKSCPTPYF